MADNLRKIAIGGDHAGFVLKRAVAGYLVEQGYQVHDFGPDSEESADYPDHVHPLSGAVETGECDLGIVICGSGNGVSITANKHRGIRAALCWMPEIAKLARAHNDANVLALPGRFIETERALETVKAFLDTPFEGGRHQRRVGKIAPKRQHDDQ